MDPLGFVPGGAAVVVVLATAGLALAARRWLLFPVRVTSRSMEPTLRHGAIVPALRRRRRAPVRRGDVVVLDSQELGMRVVKRVIGLPGERVVVGRSGRVAVDGLPLAEPYVREGPGPAGSFLVPEGHVLVLGDNRPASNDSRQWRRAAVPLSAIRGRMPRGCRIAGRPPAAAVTVSACAATGLRSS